MQFKAILLIFIATIAPCASSVAQEPTASTYKKTGNADYDDVVQRFVDKIAPKIVGGTLATPGAYPWQVSFVVSNINDPGKGHFCGGSIYKDKWIITAAHCVKGLNPSQFHVIAGTYKLTKAAKRNAVARTIIHGAYETAAPSDSDVALVELEQPLKLDDTAKAVTVLSPADEPKILKEGEKLIVTGWGTTEEGGDVVRDLREVSVPFVTNKACNDPLSYGGQITDTMICAGLAAGGKDSCQGDSGGPLVSTSSPIQLVGVVSWGEGCAKPGKYGVYTRIANFKTWIDACVTGGSCPKK